MEITGTFQYKIDTSMQKSELLFKEYYIQHPERHLKEPHMHQEVSDIIKTVANSDKVQFPQLMLDSLSEELFIDPTYDAAVYRHIRYLPAIHHSHDFFEIIYLLQGSCENYILNQKIEMSVGDFFIIAPNTEHAISVFSDECILINLLIKSSTFEQTFLGILSETDLLSDFFMRTLYHSKETPYLQFRTNGAANTRNFMIYAYEESCLKRRYKRQMMNSIITALFTVVLRDHEKDVVVPALSHADSDENLIFILRYIQENYRTVTLKELSSFFNYSERHLQRLIKSATGISFIENIQKLKMSAAVKMLEKSDATINDISEQLGYCAVNNFRNIFKKYYGMTPAEYRVFGKKNSLLLFRYDFNVRNHTFDHQTDIYTINK